MHRCSNLILYVYVQCCLTETQPLWILYSFKQWVEDKKEQPPQPHPSQELLYGWYSKNRRKYAPSSFCLLRRWRWVGGWKGRQKVEQQIEESNKAWWNQHWALLNKDARTLFIVCTQSSQKVHSSATEDELSSLPTHATHAERAN